MGSFTPITTSTRSDISGLLPNHGMVLCIQDQNQNFQKIPHLSNCTLNFGARETLTAPVHDQLLEIKVVGARKGAQVSGSFIWDEANTEHQRMEQFFNSSPARQATFQIQFPSTITSGNNPNAEHKTYTFEGYVSTFNPSGEVDALKMVDFVIEINAAIDTNPEVPQPNR